MDKLLRSDSSGLAQARLTRKRQRKRKFSDIGKVGTYSASSHPLYLRPIVLLRIFYGNSTNDLLQIFFRELGQLWSRPFSCSGGVDGSRHVRHQVFEIQESFSPYYLGSMIVTQFKTKPVSLLKKNTSVNARVFLYLSTALSPQAVDKERNVNSTRAFATVNTDCL